MTSAYTALPLAAAVSVLIVGSQANAAERQLDAHEHGHGTLNIAIEGKQVLMELEAPGADIVGFEHPAESAEDKAAVANAKAQLAQPMTLISIGADAGCSIAETTVALEGDVHDDHGHEAHDDDHGHAKHDDDHGHEAHDDDHADAKHDDDHGHAEHAEHDDDHDHAEHEASHNEFHAAYKLVCERPDRIATLGFPYFELFPGAQELDVTVVTETGQYQYEVERSRPQLTLKGF